MKNDKEPGAKTAVAPRQRYSAEFKRALVRMSLVPRASAAKIALKYQLNANLLFKWRRLYLREISGAKAASVKLLPVRVREYGDVPAPAALETISNARSSGQQRSGTIELELPEGRVNGNRILIHFSVGRKSNIDTPPSRGIT